MAWRRGLSPFDSAGAAAFSPRKQTPRRTNPPNSPIDARAGYVFHNGGARVMGSAQALPERIDKDTAERVAGRHFCSTDFDALATDTPGFISREQLLEAARVRNLSFTLREKSQKKFDFGFVAEEKEGADDGAKPPLAPGAEAGAPQVDRSFSIVKFTQEAADEEEEDPRRGPDGFDRALGPK